LKLFFPLLILLAFFLSSPDPKGASVYLVSPPNDTYTNENNDTLKFIYNRTSSLSGVINCTLYLDGVPVNYTTSVPPNQEILVYSNTSILEGKHHWWVNCTNGTQDESSLSVGHNFSFYVDRGPPIVDFVNPTPANGSALSQNYVEINASINDSINVSAFIDWNHSLVGYWSFDSYNESGIYDNSSYKNFGWFRGGLSVENLTYGKFGRGANFDGVNSYVEVDNSSSLNLVENFTISLWIRPAVDYTSELLDQYYMFVEAPSPGWGFLAYGGWVGRIIMKMRIGGNQDTLYCKVNLTRGRWYHIVSVRRGTDGWIFVNGELCSAESVLEGKLGPLLSPLKIGEGVNGTLDEVQIWNRALSGDEIKALYNAKSSLFINLTGLEDGDYKYKAYAIDAAGNTNLTERSVTVDTVPPEIKFENPTPASGEILNWDYVVINVSVGDENEVSSFIDWNGSLIGYWSFEHYNGSGVFDNSSYENFGQYTGGLGADDITCGRFGKGLEFDGSGYLAAPNFEELRLGDADISIGMWIKTTTNSCAIMKIGATGGRITVENDFNKVRVYVFNDSEVQFSTALNLPPLPKNEWLYFVVTREGDVVKLYANGEYYTSFNITGSVNLTKPLYIGAGSFGTYFHGVLDEIRVWNRVLSPQEINVSYHTDLHEFYQNFTNLSEGTYSYYVYAIDAAGNVNKSEKRTFILDKKPPKYSSDFVSGNVPGEEVKFSLYWQDDVGLNGYVFSFDNCEGKFINDSFVSFQTQPKSSWSNVTKKLSSKAGCLVRWRVYARDLAGNWNVSSIFSFLIKKLKTETKRGWIPIILKVDFFPEKVERELYVNSSEEISLTVKNTGNIKLKASIELKGNISSLLSLEEKEFSLNVGESKEIKLMLRTFCEPGLYEGNLSVKAGILTKDVKITIVVKEKPRTEERAEVQVETSLDKKFKVGEKVNFFVTVYSTETRNVSVSYSVFGPDFFKSGFVVAVVSNKTMISLPISEPGRMRVGTYTLKAEIKCDNQTWKEMRTFEVIGEPSIPWPNTGSLNVPLLITGIVVLILRYIYGI